MFISVIKRRRRRRNVFIRLFWISNIKGDSNRIPCSGEQNPKWTVDSEEMNELISENNE